MLKKKKTVLVFTCAHADPGTPNDRFSWLGAFIYDLKPDYVVDLGDGADLKSLNSFDTRYPQAIVSQNYGKDIECYNDAQERLRWKFRHHKRKRPFWIGLEGNHENRIKKAVAHDPRLQGEKYGISFGHLQTKHWFDEYHEYHNSAPVSLITMAYLTLTSLVLAIMGHLSLVFIMLTPYLSLIHI